MKKHNLTPEQREASRRLRRIWDEKHEALGLTQKKAAIALGYACQSAVSQYLSGAFSLGTNALIAWAKLLGVHLEDIDPSIKTRCAELGPMLARTEDDPIELSRDEYDWVLVRRKLSSQQQHWLGQMVAGLVSQHLP